MANRSTKPAGEPSELAAVAGRIAAILALRPQSVDESDIRLLLGNPKPLDSLRDVAAAFGAARNTVQGSWRGGGMPGASGAYDPVAILVWLLERESRRSDRAEAAGDSELELREIEWESARALLRIRQGKANAADDEYVSRVLVQSEISMGLAIIRDTIMGLPDTVRPLCPPRLANQIAGEVDRVCRETLNAAADRCLESVNKFYANGEPIEDFDENSP